MIANAALSNDKGSDDEDKTFGSKRSMQSMTPAQIDVFAAQMHKEYFQDTPKLLIYAELILLCIMSCSSQLQRTCINYMMDFPEQYHGDNNDQTHHHFNIQTNVTDLTVDNYMIMNGNSL
jgi:hypothetical protein